MTIASDREIFEVWAGNLNSSTSAALNYHLKRSADEPWVSGLPLSTAEAGKNDLARPKGTGEGLPKTC